jgi:hypothetical protein
VGPDGLQVEPETNVSLPKLSDSGLAKAVASWFQVVCPSRQPKK